MVKKPPLTQPRVLYELSLVIPGSTVSPFSYGTHKEVYLYCTRRNDAGVVALYRSRHPNDQSIFSCCRELPGPLIIE